jgi:hypothetical protein
MNKPICEPVCRASQKKPCGAAMHARIGNKQNSKLVAESNGLMLRFRDMLMNNGLIL